MSPGLDRALAVLWPMQTPVAGTLSSLHHPCSTCVTHLTWRKPPLTSLKDLPAYRPPCFSRDLPSPPALSTAPCSRNPRPPWAERGSWLTPTPGSPVGTHEEPGQSVWRSINKGPAEKQLPPAPWLNHTACVGLPATPLTPQGPSSLGPLQVRPGTPAYGRTHNRSPVPLLFL